MPAKAGALEGLDRNAIRAFDLFVRMRAGDHLWGLASSGAPDERSAGRARSRCSSPSRRGAVFVRVGRTTRRLRVYRVGAAARGDGESECDQCSEVPESLSVSDAARAVLEESNNFYTAGDVDKGLASMKDAAHYAQKATEQSIHSRKKQKQTEIGLRKLSKRIIDVKDTLNFEDKPPVLEIVYSVDKLRVRMLAAMFDLDPPKDEK